MGGADGHVVGKRTGIQYLAHTADYWTAPRRRARPRWLGGRRPSPRELFGDFTRWSELRLDEVHGLPILLPVDEEGVLTSYNVASCRYPGYEFDGSEPLSEERPDISVLAAVRNGLRARWSLLERDGETLPGRASAYLEANVRLDEFHTTTPGGLETRFVFSRAAWQNGRGYSYTIVYPGITGSVELRDPDVTVRLDLERQTLGRQGRGGPILESFVEAEPLLATMAEAIKRDFSSPLYTR